MWNSAVVATPRRFQADGVELHDVMPMYDATPLLDDPQALRQRMAQDGYLLLRGLLDRQEVLAARRTACQRLADHGYLAPGTDPMDAIARPGTDVYFIPEILAKNNAELMRVLYDGPMIRFFEQFFGEPVRHYDFTWFRSVAPGSGTQMHCDIIYMGRAEREQLYTAWTPIGAADFAQGGLVVLAGSHHNQRFKQTYGQMDVDTYCLNKAQPVPDGLATDGDNSSAWGSRNSGWLAANPNTIGRALGGQWVTSEFSAGDVVIFSMFVLHGGLDNRSQRIRLSSDSRYQPARTAADNRWIGANPVGHSKAGKLGRVC